MLETVGLAMQSAIEHLQAGEEGTRGAARRHERVDAHAVRLADRLPSRLAGAGRVGRAGVRAPALTLR